MIVYTMHAIKQSKKSIRDFHVGGYCTLVSKFAMECVVCHIKNFDGFPHIAYGPKCILMLILG